MNFRDKYQMLLDKFSGNSELLEIIEECILDDISKKEAIYLNTGQYPQQRDLLMKLKTDLIINANKGVNNG